MKEAFKKRNKKLLACLWLTALVIILPSYARSAAVQDQALEISDVYNKSEGESVAGKLYRLQELKAFAPAIVVAPGRNGTFRPASNREAMIVK